MPTQLCTGRCLAPNSTYQAQTDSNLFRICISADLATCTHFNSSQTPGDLANLISSKCCHLCTVKLTQLDNEYNIYQISLLRVLVSSWNETTSRNAHVSLGHSRWGPVRVKTHPAQLVTLLGLPYFQGDVVRWLCTHVHNHIYSSTVVG